MTRYPSGRATNWLDFGALAAGLVLTGFAAVELITDFDRQSWFLLAVVGSPLISALWMQWRMTGRLRALAEPARREQIAVTPISRSHYLYWALRDPMVALLSPLALVPAWISIELTVRFMFSDSLRRASWRLGGAYSAGGAASLDEWLSHGSYFIMLGLLTSILSVAWVLRRFALRCGERGRDRWYSLRPGYLLVFLLALAYGNPAISYHSTVYRQWWSPYIGGGSDLVIAFGSLVLLAPLYLAAAWGLAVRQYSKLD